MDSRPATQREDILYFFAQQTGEPVLCDQISWRVYAHYSLMFAGGGLAILRAIEKIGYDVFKQRPKLGKLGYLALGWDAIRGRLPH